MKYNWQPKKSDALRAPNNRADDISHPHTFIVLSLGNGTVTIISKLVCTQLFVYRTPSGYNQEFIKHDLSVLLGNPKVAYSKECEIKPLQPLSSEIREKYNI